MHSLSSSFFYHLLKSATVAPLAVWAGGMSQSLRLPRITGYLLTGIICGPYVLGIISEEATTQLWPVDFVCLSTIAVAAGSELQVSELHRTRNQVLYVCGGICIFTYLFVYMVTFFMAPFVPQLESLGSSQLHAFCSLAGCLMMARSPASAIAVLKEMDARGPFTSLVMAVVVVKDVVVIVAFALNMEVARIVFSKDESASLTLVGLMEPVLSLLASLTMGVGGAALLGMVLRPKSGLLHGMLGPAIARKLQGTVIIIHTATLFLLADLLRAEPLLACVVMGLIATNRGHNSADREKEYLHHILGAVMPITNLPFFALAGASLKMDALLGTLWLGALLYVIRLAAIWLGSYLGAMCAACPAEHRRQFWFSMVTQAGVAMGLAKTCAVRFPDWGNDYVTLMASVIILNLLSGPPMFKSALVAIGEARNTSPNIMSSSEADGAEVGLPALRRGVADKGFCKP